MDDASIGIVIDPSDENQILWVKRRDLPIWVLPGGGIDPGESPEEAVIREVEEESGIQVSIMRKAAILHPVNRFTATTHIYHCKVEKGTPSPQPESIEAGYFPIKSPPQPYFPLHGDWAALSREKELVNRPLNEFSWIRAGCFFLKHPVIFIRYLFMRIS